MTGLIRAKSPPVDTRFVSKLHCYVTMKEQLSVAQALTLRVGKRAKKFCFFQGSLMTGLIGGNPTPKYHRFEYKLV